jgi:hypothetical protein
VEWKTGNGAAKYRSSKVSIANANLQRKFFVMTAIAERLDAKLKTLDAKAASSLEKLVRDALDLIEARNETIRPESLPIDFFIWIAREFGSEPFERPPQGEFEKRGITR